MEVDRKKTNEASIHYLPCGMSYDGPTEVKSFFQVKKGKDGTMTSAIRGRELMGEQMMLSVGGVNVHGLCVTKSGNGSEARLEVTDRFDSMNIWQHDAKPDNNQIREYIDWFEINNSVHS